MSVKSWGVYLGVLGEKNKHIILAQKQLLDTSLNLYDIDYTAISTKLTHNHTSSQINNPSVSTSLNISQPVSTNIFEA